MAHRKIKYGYAGIALGAIALIMVLVHFWAGPFAPQPTFEQTIAESAASIRDATVAALKGEDAPRPQKRPIDLDRAFSTVAAVLGGIAIILAVISFAAKESNRVSIGAAALGVFAVAFQFLAVALAAIIFAIVLVAVISSFGLA